MKRNLPPFKLHFCIIAFFVLPCVLSCWLIISFYNEVKSDRLDAVAQKADSEMRQVIRDGSDEVFLQKKLNFAYGMLAEEPVTSMNISRRILDLKESGLEFVNFRFFDGNAELIPIEGESKSMKMVMQKLFDSLSAIDSKGDDSSANKNKAYFRAFFGNVNAIQLAKDKSVLKSCNVNGAPGYFYWNIFYSQGAEDTFNGGVIAWCLAKDIPVNFSIKQIIDEANEKSKVETSEFKGSYEVCCKNNAELSYPTNKYSDMSSAMVASTEAFQNFSFGQSSKVIDEKYEALRLLDGNRILKVTVPVSNIVSNKSSFGIIFIALLILCISVYIAVSNYFSIHYYSFSSRTMVLLLISMNMLAVVFTSVGFIYFSSDKQIVRIDKSLEDFLDTADKSFNIAEDSLEKTYLTFSQNKTLQDFHGSELNDYFDQLRNNSEVENVLFFENNGNLLYSYPENSAAMILGKQLKPVALKLFSSLKNNEKDWKDRITQLAADTITRTVDDLLGSDHGLMAPFETTGRLHRISINNKVFYVFSDFIQLSRKRDPVLMFVWNKLEKFGAKYLRELVDNVKKEYSENNKDEFMTVEADQKFNSMPYPAEFSKYNFINNLRFDAVSEGTTQKSYGFIAGERCRAAAKRLKFIPEKILMAVKPAEEFNKKQKYFSGLLILNVFMYLAAAYIWFHDKKIVE